jgi:hypothetical protein
MLVKPTNIGINLISIVAMAERLVRELAYKVSFTFPDSGY